MNPPAHSAARAIALRDLADPTHQVLRGTQLPQARPKFSDSATEHSTRDGQQEGEASLSEARFSGEHSPLVEDSSPNVVDIFILLLRYANAEDFRRLAEQLGLTEDEVRRRFDTLIRQ